MRFIDANDNRMILVQEEPRGPSQLVEIPVTANQTKVQFPDVANLRNQSDQKIIIKALRWVTPSVLTVAPDSGGANAPLTEVQKISLILYSEGWIKGQNVPLASLSDIFTEGSGEPWKSRPTKLDSWQNFDWNKCYLQFSNGTQSVGAYTVILEVEYVRYVFNRDTNNWDEVVGPQ